MPIQDVYEFLDSWNVPYERLLYDECEAMRDGSAESTVWAKTCVIRLDGRPSLAIYPADSCLDLMRIQAATGNQTAVFARENEVVLLFPACDPSAIPPFPLRPPMEIFVDRSLLEEDAIAFATGTRNEFVRMNCQDYRRLTRPTTGPFAIRAESIARR